MNLLNLIVILITLYTVILLFLWAFQNPYLQYLGLFYPLILLVGLLQYLPIQFTYFIVIALSIALTYYLVIFFNPYSVNKVEVEERTEVEYEGYDNPPQGPKVENDNWETSYKNTKYYQNLSEQKGYPTSVLNQKYQGQSGPCVRDDRFGIQYSFGKRSMCHLRDGLPASVNGNKSVEKDNCPKLNNPTECLPRSSTDFDEACRKQYQKDMGFRELSDCGCKPNYSKADCESGYKNGMSSELSESNTTDCLGLNLPPSPHKLEPQTKTDANPDLWCRLERNTRRARAKRVYQGAEAGCYQQNRPDMTSERAECEKNSIKNEYGERTTECYNWSLPDWIWKAMCGNDKYMGKIVGDCPPSQGRAICKKN